MSQLTQEHIIEKALETIDQEGLQALSMRRLGRDLGVDAKALYYYFANKESLMTGVLNRAFAELDLPAALPGRWQDQIRQIVRAYNDLIAAHPNLVPYLARIDGSIPVIFEIVERAVASLSGTGLSGRSIVQIIDLLVSLAPSVALWTDDAGSFEQVHRRISNLPAERFPIVTQLMQTLSAEDLKEDFDFQMNIIINGIEQLIEQQRSRAQA